MEIYEYNYGTCATEQDFITEISSFMVSTIGGWEVLDTISDTTTNRDYVWKSSGENPTDYQDIYVRMRGESNNVYVYGYGLWESASAYWQELYNVTYSYVPTYSLGLRYWMYGNRDFVCFTILNYGDGLPYTGYLGLVESSYVPEDDPYPILCRGQKTSYYTWHSSNYQYMHAPVASGTQRYHACNWDTLLDADIGLREIKLLFLPPVLLNAAASNNEVRGRPYGVYQVSGNRAPSMAPITTASGVFLCFRDGTTSYSDRTYAYGPVASGIGDFSMW